MKFKRSKKLSGYIIFIVIHLIVVEIFPFGPKLDIL